MTLIKQIVEDLGDLSKVKLVRPFDIKYLGYKFSKKKVTVRDSKYILYELIDEDSNHSVSFCFLLVKKSNMGIVLSFPFDRYLQMARAEVAEARKLKRPHSIKRRGRGK